MLDTMTSRKVQPFWGRYNPVCSQRTSRCAEAGNPGGLRQLTQTQKQLVECRHNTSLFVQQLIAGFNSPPGPVGRTGRIPRHGLVPGAPEQSEYLAEVRRVHLATYEPWKGSNRVIGP